METNNMSDKTLIRKQMYQEALGENFNSKPYCIIQFYNGESGDNLEETFETKEDAELKCVELGLKDYIICNINHGWL